MKTRYLLTALLAFLLQSCTPEAIRVSSITLNTKSLDLEVGMTEVLIATVSPSDAANLKVIWFSDNSSVAKVSSDGSVTAVSPGTARISAKTDDGGISDICTVTVINPVKALKLEPKESELYVGDETDIAVSLDPAEAKVNVLFTSENPDVATVDEASGHVKALSAGHAVIIATVDYKGIKPATSRIHVRNRIQSVTVTSPVKEVNVGETFQLEAKVLPANLRGASLSWSSSDESIATIDEQGVVTTKARGTVTFTATVENGPADTKSGSCQVKVLQPVTSINVEPTSIEMIEGEVIEIEKACKITIEPADADDASYQISPSDAQKVQVSEGKITALKNGTAKLYFRPKNSNPEDLKAVLTITVGSLVSDINISGNKKIKVGETLQLTATIIPSSAPDKRVTWKSSDPAVAQVDEKGLVTANSSKAGTTTITVTSVQNPKVTTTCKVVVEDIPIESVTLNKTSLQLIEGEKSEMLEATVFPENTNLDRGVTWKSSNTKVATVKDGVVTAVAAGSATITAISKADGSKEATCSVTVSSKVVAVQSVSLNKNELELEIGKSEALAATVNPSNATNKTVTWTSSKESVATVDNSGKVTAKATGTAIITVKTQDGGKTATCKVTVPEPPVPVNSISLSQKSATLTFGQSISVDVTVLPEDATDPSWECTSSNTSIASVSKSGAGATITAGSKAGTATITFKSVKYPDVTTTFSVTVKAQIIYVTSVSIQSGNLTMYIGQTKQVTAIVTPSNADNKAIKWTVNQGAVVSVDQNGNITAVKEGKSRVIAKSQDGSGMQDYIEVTVKKNSVASVSLSKSELVLKKGESFDLKATVTAQDPSAPASNPKVTWDSSKTSVATVDSSGRVITKSAGEVTITVTSDDDKSKKATCKVKVLSGDTGNGGTEGIGYDDWNFD